jgi:diguanylate cyclase (GGDEF)-like protein
MKLRNKVLISIGLVWAIFLIVTFTASHFFLLHSFLALEDERANRDLNRVSQALAQNSSTLYAYTSDWSHWTDAYNFMKGKNPRFVADNFKMPAFINSNINLITYWNHDGTQVAGKAINTNTQKYIHYPKGLDKYIYSNSPLVKAHKNLSGYILIGDEIMAIASTTITDGDKSQPSLGVAVFGRFLSPQILKKINQSTQVSTILFLPKQIAANPELTQIFKTISTGSAGSMINLYDKSTLHGYIVIKDINDQPIGMLQTTTARLIYLSGLKIINYYLASFIALGILFSLLTLWLLRVLIIERLESLNHDVEKISKNNTLSQRVNEQGNDEIVSLAHQINSMMNIIEASQTKLEHRVKERTQELQKTNIQLQQEIAERKSIEKELIIHRERLIRLAHYDNLTALPNRLFFNELLTKIVNHAHRKKSKLAILYIDLDKFKTINDALGHPVGDLVLKEIANRFLKIIRSSDILARLSGDEFAILLNDIDHPKFASSIAEKILTICSQPLKINNYEFILTTSIGISTYPEDGTSLEDLLKNADMAMYKAKKAGGGVFNYYTKAMDLEAHERIKLESALRNAIHRNEFLLYYQPKLQLSDSAIIGVEALIRWKDPVLGLISPEKFIPLAEETSLILQIGEWVLREACRANKSWQEKGYEPITVAVNLSAKQFHHPDIIGMIEKVLAETKLEPKYLELEITETAMMNNIDTAIETLHAIKRMGVKISIDDFGTGYTSINHFKQFPINVIKIDKSFIKELPTSHNDASITTAIIALAHSLNIKVVAEGVETAKQLQFLIDHDCDMVQGYYFSQPVTEANLALQLKIKATTTIA